MVKGNNLLGPKWLPDGQDFVTAWYHPSAPLNMLGRKADPHSRKRAQSKITDTQTTQS